MFARNIIMKIRIKKRHGYWKTYFVYNPNSENRYEVYMDKYTSFQEALAVSLFVVGLDRSV
jgi:hypothetical protein